ncbi:unnamed protein product, partial [Chrysoparadoxa australica]
GHRARGNILYVLLGKCLPVPPPSFDSMLRKGLAPRGPIRAMATNIQSIEKIGVIGLGLMGSGIAQACASGAPQSYQVVAIESSEDALSLGKARVESSVSEMAKKAVERGKMTAERADEKVESILSRLSYDTDKGALADCDMTIEAIVENIDVKLPFYEDLGRITKPSCILASNTSSLKIEHMALASGRPERVVGLHFFNPVQLMKLVEVVKTDLTDHAVFSDCLDWVQSIGKHAVSCSDTPGFIVNRLLVPALAQGMLMVDRGDASIPDIDKSMELGAGHPMGPLTLADYVGLDTCLAILQGWVEQYPEEKAFVVPECLKIKVAAAGKLGRKSGEGFYRW